MFEVGDRVYVKFNYGREKGTIIDIGESILENRIKYKIKFDEYWICTTWHNEDSLEHITALKETEENYKRYIQCEWNDCDLGKKIKESEKSMKTTIKIGGKEINIGTFNVKEIPKEIGFDVKLVRNKNLPDKYIINDNATILFWGDEKVVVKKSEDDIFDAEKSFLWAYFLRNSGMTRTQANKYLKKVKESVPDIYNALLKEKEEELIKYWEQKEKKEGEKNYIKIDNPITKIQEAFSELVNPKQENAFKVGDRVKVKGYKCDSGIGTIIEIEDDGNEKLGKYRIEFDNYYATTRYRDDEIELLKEE